MEKSTFRISKMDCPSEEQLIRMQLGNFTNIKKLDFDIENRKLTIYHSGNTAEIENSINALNLNSVRIDTVPISIDHTTENLHHEKRLLWTVLFINAALFFIEAITGLISRSLGLVADSLDMLADAFVYGLSLFAVGRSMKAKKNVARVSGYFQMILAAIGFIEVIRRFLLSEKTPDFKTMIIVSVFALIGNAFCLFLLQKSKSKEVHMKASMIFTSNDVIVNLGVITAGLLVFLLESNKPDLIIGSVVFFIVMRGAIRILKLADSRVS